MVHHQEDLVASPLHMIIRAYAAKHWRESQLRPGLMASITETVMIRYVYYLSNAVARRFIPPASD